MSIHHILLTTCYSACFYTCSYLLFFLFPNPKGPSLQQKSYTSGANGMSGVLELSEASIESSGAKAAACGTLSVLSSVSNKGTNFSWDIHQIHVDLCYLLCCESIPYKVRKISLMIRNQGSYHAHSQSKMSCLGMFLNLTSIIYTTSQFAWTLLVCCCLLTEKSIKQGR